MRPSPRLSRTHGTLVAAFALALVAACSQEPTPSARSGGDTPSGSGNANANANANGSSSANGASGGSGDPAGGSGTTSGSPGTTTGGAGAEPSGGSDAGLPPPSLPPQPNGFQETIAPLLDAQGCTECHHHGRAIDLTTYPFMAGAAADTAQQLVTAFTSGMPPAPRTAAPQSVIDQVNAWVAAGMKP